MEFDWDPEKDRTNLAKHGIDFGAAIRIFFGPVLDFRTPHPDELAGWRSGWSTTWSYPSCTLPRRRLPSDFGAQGIER